MHLHINFKLGLKQENYYIEEHKWITLKKAVINPQNHECHMCFKEIMTMGKELKRPLPLCGFISRSSSQKLQPKISKTIPHFYCVLQSKWEWWSSVHQRARNNVWRGWFWIYWRKQEEKMSKSTLKWRRWQKSF